MIILAVIGIYITKLQTIIKIIETLTSTKKSQLFNIIRYCWLVASIFCLVFCAHGILCTMVADHTELIIAFESKFDNSINRSDEMNKHASSLFTPHCFAEMRIKWFLSNGIHGTVWSTVNIHSHTQTKTNVRFSAKSD